MWREDVRQRNGAVVNAQSNKVQPEPMQKPQTKDQRTFQDDKYNVKTPVRQDEMSK